MSAVKVKNVAALSRNYYKRLNQARLLSDQKCLNFPSIRKTLPRRGGVKAEGVDSQGKIMVACRQRRKRAEASLAGLEDSGAEPVSQGEVALARIPCRRKTCGVHGHNLQREIGGVYGASRQYPCQTMNVWQRRFGGSGLEPEGSNRNAG